MFHITQREKLILPSIYRSNIKLEVWRQFVSSVSIRSIKLYTGLFQKFATNLSTTGEKINLRYLSALWMKKKLYQFRKIANIRELQHNIVNLIILQCSKIRNWICSRDFPLQTLFDQNSPYSHGEFCAYKERCDSE